MTERTRQIEAFEAELLDVIGSGSDEDNALFLRYYASDEEREY